MGDLYGGPAYGYTGTRQDREAALLTLDIVGCGEVALQFHGPVLRHLRHSGLVRVAGCYDPQPARARRLCRLVRGERWSTSAPPEPTPHVNAVLVATPPEVQPTVALPYLRAGRHVLVEKPFAATRARADLLVATAREHGARVLVGHLRRFYPSVQIARAWLQASGLGVIRRAVACEGARWGVWPTQSTYAVEDPFGGVLYDTGAHLLDTLLFVLGADQQQPPVIEVNRAVRDRAQEPSQDFQAEFTIQANGLGRIPVRLAVSRTRAIPGGVRLEGDRGALLIPPAFAAAPRLIVDGHVFPLDQPAAAPRAMDVLGSIKLEHLELVQTLRTPDRRSVLDADRFLVLTDVFDALVRAATAS